MTRILHTSDWHLGASLEGVPREDDHKLFLDWLCATLVRERIDVLVVAGDVFDQAQPSAEAQRLYYRFLNEAASHVGKIVVVGGNHDSASRLDAPRDLLSALKIHVVGGVSADRSSWDRCLCPITGDGVTQCVIAAVPFVHEFRLGVKTALRDEGEIRASFTEAFRTFYKELADRAALAADGAPLIATGHLAAEGAEPADSPAEVHMIGTIGALSSSIFDPRFRYIALGHVHRSYHVKDSRAWYSGTPVPLGITEASVPRRVLVFDTEAPDGEPVSVQVPAFRLLTKIRGPIEQVTEAIRTLAWDTPLPPFVYTEVEVEQYTAGVDAHLARAAEEQMRKGLRLLLPKQVRVVATAEGSAAQPEVKLTELTPEDVFRRLCEAKEETLDEPLLLAFRSLLASPEEGESP